MKDWYGRDINPATYDRWKTTDPKEFEWPNSDEDWDSEDARFDRRRDRELDERGA